MCVRHLTRDSAQFLCNRFEYYIPDTVASPRLMYGENGQEFWIATYSIYTDPTWLSPNNQALLQKGHKTQ